MQQHHHQRHGASGCTVVDAALQQGAVLLEEAKLVDGEERVVDAVRLAAAAGPRRHWHRAQVQVIAYRVLQVMIHRSFGVARVQILAQILRQTACHQTNHNEKFSNYYCCCLTKFTFSNFPFVSLNLSINCIYHECYHII